MSTASLPSLAQLKRAVHLAEELQRLEAELAGLLGNAVAEATPHHETSAVSRRAPGKRGPGRPKSTAPAKKAVAGGNGRRELSPEGKARIAEAARRRWEEYRKNKA